MASYAFDMPYWQDNRIRQSTQKGSKQKPKRKGNAKTKVKAQPDIEDEDMIADSLLHTRWKIQPTVPITFDDLYQSPLDLKRPQNIEQKVVYNDTLNRYIFGSKLGDQWIAAPIMMTPEEYKAWSEKQMLNKFFRSKNEEMATNRGKEKFDFTDMHFDLGPAEKIFGPGGVRIRTQGTAELKFGGTIKKIDNPSLPIRNRKMTTMDFDEKINLNVNGRVGDKVNMNLNYNTDATFDFDTQNMKLKYDGKEDEIIKLVEAGNVSFPSNSSLIKGASSLFGLRTDMQFGKLKLQLVASQKKSSDKSVSSKGGKQFTPFEINVANYEENRHFFLSQYFRSQYDACMQTLPNIVSSIKINRIEIWVTNNSGVTNNTRNIVALTDLGENKHVSNKTWNTTGQPVPSNQANTEYNQLVQDFGHIRNIDDATSVLDGAGLVGGVDYEKLEHARLLNPSEYKVNTALGYVSLRTSLQSDQVLAVAYEYTYGGTTYQVGEFASDITDAHSVLFVKSLKNTSNNPRQGNWNLMMKNVYELANSVEREKFRLDVKYQSDTAGVYLNYIPEQQVKSLPIIRLLGADRLDNNNKIHSNGYFDFVEGYTVSDGRIFFPKVEPFGSYIYQYLISKGVDATKARSYAFTELYDSTKTVAKQIAEKNKYILTGQYRGSAANVISLGAYNVPQGSVVVTAGGVRLTENADYSVDYAAGEVTILNQSIIDAGTNVNVSLESNTDFAQQRKTMFGLNWEYDFSKDFLLSGTFQHLGEQALTNKVNLGTEPLNNTLWGVNLNWKKESQWLTNVLDKIPFLHLTLPSQISLNAEFAHLIAGQSHGTQDNASYLDDFENTTTKLDVSTPTSWIISSVPSMFPEHSDKTTLRSGFNRSLLAWYTIDPLFTRRSSSYTPSHIKSDLEQLSNHYVREVYVNELYPNRDQSSYMGTTATLPILNLAYYPSERGPYNFNPDLTTNGFLNNPREKWGGMMRRLDYSDFEASNIEYIEFWMLDPFIYTHRKGTAQQYGGDFYINLGEISEDVLHDGKKFYESGLPVDGSKNYIITQWGKIPVQPTVTYSFATGKDARSLQDLGFNGLTDEEEKNFAAYQDFLKQIQGKVNPAVFAAILKDVANDDYHYFRGRDYDEMKASILQRYKYINNPQGNSPDTESRTESYDTSYKSTPDVEDINQDYTLNEYEKYYQYHVSIRPEDLVIGRNYIIDKREAYVPLRNNKKDHVTWYLFRIPVREYEKRIGSISDFTSIRFMRMFLTGFEKPIVLRFGSLDLVRGDWRIYQQQLDEKSTQHFGVLSVSSVNIEENNDKTPVNYVLPPGIVRAQDPTQSQLVEANEQALDMVVDNLGSGESKAVYKNTSVDLRQYKRMQLFVHANANEHNNTQLQDNQLSIFVRLGSDYKNNYYEYEIPLKLTPPGKYDRYSLLAVKKVWPEENMLDIALDVFTHLKKQRNKAKAMGEASYNRVYSAYDEHKPNNKISIMGNPTLGEVKTMMIGVRNKSDNVKSGEVWVNEMRLLEYNSNGGWAAQGNLNVQMSDLGSLNVQGRYTTEGFGGLEEGVEQRAKDKFKNYSVTANIELGKFFPEKAKVSAPLYYSIQKEEVSPKYNPLDTDMCLKDALEAAENKPEYDSIESIAVTKTTNTNFSLSNIRVGIQTKRHPMPYDPANFSFSYSHSHRQTSGKTTVYEKEDVWNGSMSYNWSPVYKTFEPFKRLKGKWLNILRRFGLNWLPQTIAFNSDINRSYYELQERDMQNLGGQPLPLTFSEQFLWNRDFNLRWDVTRNLHLNFQSATHAEIEEPYTPVNKELYADHYSAWKDSVLTSIRHLGTPLDYQQQFSMSYQLPLNLIPIFDWVRTDANYSSRYTWVRGTKLEDGTSLGNTVSTNRQLSVNGNFDLQRLYNHIPFLKAANEKFYKEPSWTRGSKHNMKNKCNKQDNTEEKLLKKKKNRFQQEIVLRPDTTFTVYHGKNSKRIIVSAKTQSGKTYPLKYKKIDKNAIRIQNKVDSTLHLKITVQAKEPLKDKGWYKTVQGVARLLMMVRNVGISYRNDYTMALPGFMPMAGDAFGQHRMASALSPGLDFAFGMIDDSYIERARDKQWLMVSDSIATPATTNHTENLQLRITLEPVHNFKIDLNATRTHTSAKSVQYMYEGTPITENGNFTMTTISLRSAFEGMGSADNGFYSKSFTSFCNSLEGFRRRVEAQYQGFLYPQGSPLAGQPFNAANGGVDKYCADVMIPAFIDNYTSMGGHSLELFPVLTRLLPNWDIHYNGLGKLPWFRDVFKSITLNHSYKSLFTIGSYSSFSTYQEVMHGHGFITNATTGNPIPKSMYNVSMVSINEAFSPLLGIDVTFYNDITAKLEYRSMRVLSLSTTNMQISEATSRDWVLGMAYRINDFNPFVRLSDRKHHSYRKGNQQQDNYASRNNSNMNRGLNLRLDCSYRQQASINRDIATMTSAASSGNTAFKFQFSADYTLSRLITMTFYYEQQTNRPLLANSSYPTTTHDFGLSLKFSLTR